MKTKMKNSTKRLLLLAAATVTAASAMAVGMGNSYMANASTDYPVETLATYADEQYTDTYQRAGQYKITDSGPIKQSYDVFDWKHMPSYNEFVSMGYSYITVTVKLAMREEDRGYQQVYLYPNEDKVYENFKQRIEVQYAGDKLNKKYSDVYFYFKTLPLSDFATNNTLGLVIRYGATGGGEDDWYNQSLVVTVTVSKNVIQERNAIKGNVSFDDGYNNP